LQAAALVLARRSVERKETSQAREYLLKAAQARPSDPEPHRRLAEVYESSGDYAAAQRQREQATASVPIAALPRPAAVLATLDMPLAPKGSLTPDWLCFVRTLGALLAARRTFNVKLALFFGNF